MALAVRILDHQRPRLVDVGGHVDDRADDMGLEAVGVPGQRLTVAIHPQIELRRRLQREPHQSSCTTFSSSAAPGRSHRGR